MTQLEFSVALTWQGFGYHNPVKHGYVKKGEDYEFSSYNYYLKKLGKEYMDSIFAQYPIIDFTDRNDEF